MKGAYNVDSVNVIPSVVDEKLAYTAGVSKSNPIGATVLNDSRGIAPQVGSVRMNRYSTDNAKDQHDNLKLSFPESGLVKIIDMQYNPLAQQEKKQKEALDPA